MTERILRALIHEERAGSCEMPEELILREKARAAIKVGRMPAIRHERTWGGPGTGGPCSVCDLPLTKDQPEFEIEFARNGFASSPGTFLLHARCFAAWEFERTETPN
jgi:hypothetical protein